MLFSQNELSGLQIANALLITFGQRPIGRIEGAVDEALDIPLDLQKLFLDRIHHCHAAFGLGIPQVFQHGMEQPEQVLAWPHGREQLFEVTFDLLLLDSLAIGRAHFVVAVIIDVVFRAAFGAAAGERAITIAAFHEAAQRHQRVQIDL